MTNEFVTFQNFINDTLMNFLNKFVIIYLNDIFIYNNNLKKHKNYVRKIFQKLREIEIQIDIDKCEFHKTEIKFLKIWINKNEIRMNSIKMIAINEWKISQNLQQIQSFFDFVNFYRRFIKKFSIVIKSLIKFIKKNTSFEWSFVCQSIFIEFKKKMIEISMLIHFNFDRQTIIESNSNDYVFADIMFQKNENDVIRSIIYFSKILLSIECNYEIYDKKLLIIVKCFEKWKFELQFVMKSTRMFIDHKIFEYFMITKKLNRRQIKWTEFLIEFDFVIFYQTNKMHAKIDFLTKKFEHKFVSKNDDKQRHQLQTILISNKLNKRIKKNLDELYLQKIIEISKNDKNIHNFYIDIKID